MIALNAKATGGVELGWLGVVEKRPKVLKGGLHSPFLGRSNVFYEVLSLKILKLNDGSISILAYTYKK